MKNLILIFCLISISDKTLDLNKPKTIKKIRGSKYF